MTEKDRSQYESPLGTRYGKGEMSSIWSDDFKFQTWRQCWVALARAQQELGLAGVTQEKVAQLERFVSNINYGVAEAREREVRHDVMSHVYAFGQQCPEAAGIIHAGATSCDITDNTELLQIRKSFEVVTKKGVNTVKLLRDFAMQYKDLPVLAFTHYQPAQPTTLGKRAAMWLQDLFYCVGFSEAFSETIPLRGLKGTTGTQASFLELADGDSEKAKELNRVFLRNLGQEIDFPITGQTYPRIFDSFILTGLSVIAQAAYKAGSDIRMMQHSKEMEEPFGKSQIGSSAMAYKRNPMRSERMCSLARHVVTLELEPRMTVMGQWFERTLDDSAGRRIYLPEAFLATDEILNLYMNIMEDPVVNRGVIKRNLEAELPFMATEAVLMAAVKKGEDRQVVHEAIRQDSQGAASQVKQGYPNKLLDIMAEDSRIPLDRNEIGEVVDVKRFIGRAPEQVEEFVATEIDPFLIEHEDLLGEKSDVRV